AGREVDGLRRHPDVARRTDDARAHVPAEQEARARQPVIAAAARVEERRAHELAEADDHRAVEHALAAVPARHRLEVAREARDRLEATELAERLLVLPVVEVRVEPARR